MKIIDLLNKIADEEEVPKKIKFNHIEYNLIHGEMNDCYVDDGDNDLFIHIFRHNLEFSVNDEVEILDDEEKGLPEKLEATLEFSEDGNYTSKVPNNEQLMFKINEILDYLEKQSKGE